jgi:hypothetical protein
VKWSMERFYRWDRNVLGAPNLLSQNLHIVKPSCPDSGLYPQTMVLSNLYSLKTPVNFVGFCMVFAGFCRNKYIKVW